MELLSFRNVVAGLVALGALAFGSTRLYGAATPPATVTPPVTITCTGAYQDTLWDTPSGHLEQGVSYDGTAPETASTTLFAGQKAAKPIGVGSWKLCTDPTGKTREFRISNAEYQSYGQRDAKIPDQAL